MRMPKTAAKSAASGGPLSGATSNGSAGDPGAVDTAAPVGTAASVESNGHGPAPRNLSSPATASTGTAGPGTASTGTGAASTGTESQPPGSDRTRKAHLALRYRLSLLRVHWVATLLLAAGLALRVLTQFTFSPALLYIDSVKYLYAAWPGADPLGYDAPLKLILMVGNLRLVEAVQHLLGLGMAVTLYLVLVRRGVPRWLAALAMGPILLDAYQLQMEATIMPDVWFEAAIVAGLAVLLWKSRPSLWMCLLAGVLLGASATVRQVGEILIVPAVLFVAVGAGGWRQALKKCAATCAAFALPIVAYSSGSYALTGHFWLSRNGYQATYGRMAAVADCATLRIPAGEQSLCPTPAQQARGADWLDHAAGSPLRNYVAPAGTVRSKEIANFNKSVAIQQPVRVVKRISDDAIKLFAVTRTTSPGDTAISRWQFHTTYPQLLPTIIVGPQGSIVLALKLAVSGGPTIYRKLDAAYGGNARVWAPGAAFLRRYQLYGGYTPGPLLLLTLLLGLAGSLTIFRRRASAAQRQLALGALLFTATAVTVLLMSDLFEFSWRYQLPALVTLPPAGAFGLATLLRYARRRKTERTAATADPAQRVAARAG
jgi:hypothetical protein